MFRIACLGFVLFCGLPFSLLAAEADPQRPASMEVENVPVVPVELSERLQKYQAIRHARFRGWSPDGKGMLIQTQFGNTPQLHRVLTPGADRTQVTFEAEPVDGRFVPNRTDGILTIMSAGGNENDQLYWRPWGDKKPQLMTDGKSRNILEAVSNDGYWMVIASNRRNGRDMDILLGDLRQPGNWTELLQVDKATWQVLGFSPDGRELLVMRVVSINERYPALLNIESKKLTPIPPPPGTEGKVAIGTGAFASDGKSIYLTSDANSEFLRLAQVKLPELTYDWLTPGIPADIDHLAVDKHSSRLAVTANADGRGSIYVLDGKELKLISGHDWVVDSLEFSPDGKQLGFTWSPPDGPSEAYSIPLPRGLSVRWTTSETEGFSPGSFVKPKLVVFPTFDQREVQGYVFKPKTASNAHRAPVLISIHGGPEGQYRPYFSGTDQYYVNELGIAVICPNVRGSAGYGKTYLQLDNGDKREDSVKDIGALLDWIKLQPDLDSERVAVIGASYGGYMVLGSLVMHGERLRAGIDIVGIANFITFLENTSEYRRDLRRVEYGDERDAHMRAVFEKISPAKNADKIKSALLVAHGKNDPRVPFSEARQIAPLVRKNGQDVWTVYADNEGHGFRKKDNRDYFAAVTTMFLQQHLQPAAAPVAYDEHLDLTYYRDQAGKKHPIEKPADWEIRRQHILANLQLVTGPLPGAKSRVPLDVKLVEEKQIGKLTRRKITYQTDADDRVASWLFIPEHKAGQKLPTVLCLQQTTGIGKDEPAGLGGNPNLHYALHLAERGYVTLAPDYPSFGEHKYDFAPSHGYVSGTMKAVWDNVRSVDLLSTLPEVDATRIGVIGHSLGGHNALLTAAFEPRLKVIVSSCGYCRFHKDDVPSWTGPRYMPRIASVYQNSADKLPFDFTEIIGSLAPRPFFTSAAQGDDDFDVVGVKETTEAARPVYKLFGKAENLKAVYPPGPHNFPNEAREEAYKFLDQHLKR
ncbi:MAG: ptpA 1 [Planctomycetaceae bacterium]|nr:ptpA 1 [Planctomycetaceae bacterium]